MENKTPAARATRLILAVTALLLPTLSLVPLGGLYLWEKGWLLYWAGGALVTIALISLTQRHLLRGSSIAIAGGGTPAGTPEEIPEPYWSPVEKKAWADVMAIAAKVDVDKLQDADALLALAHKTINTVAERLHPEKEDAVWRFTMPEALAITERVSRRLGAFVIANIPFGDRLTVSQILQIYRWRHMADLAERAYDIWRLVRLTNPATAITNEARERLSRALLQWGREHVTRRLGEAFVEEVGRAAIDLYGGRLRIPPPRQEAGAPERWGPQPPPAYRVLVAGGDTTRRAAVVRALDARQREAAKEAIESARAHRPFQAPVAIDVRASEASGVSSRAFGALSAEAREADMLVLLLASSKQLSEEEQALIEAVDRAFMTAPAMLPPILIPVIPDPALETLNANSAAGTVMALYSGPVAEAVAAIDGDVAAIWKALLRAEEPARSVRAVRAIAAMGERQSWTRTGRQAAAAVASLARSAFSRRKPPAQ